MPWEWVQQLHSLVLCRELEYGDSNFLLAQCYVNLYINHLAQCLAHRDLLLKDNYIFFYCNLNIKMEVSTNLQGREKKEKVEIRSTY